MIQGNHQHLLSCTSSWPDSVPSSFKKAAAHCIGALITSWHGKSHAFTIFYLLLMIVPVLALSVTNSQVTYFEIKTSFSRPSGASKVLLFHTHVFQMCLYISGMCEFVCIYLLITPYKVIHLRHCVHAACSYRLR